VIWRTASALYDATMKYLVPLIVAATPVFADAPVVENITYAGARFDVTLSHADTGWEDYADGWRVELEDGTVLGTRVLGHPHVNEQPFTRSASITSQCRRWSMRQAAPTAHHLQSFAQTRAGPQGQVL